MMDPHINDILDYVRYYEPLTVENLRPPEELLSSEEDEDDDFSVGEAELVLEQADVFLKDAKAFVGEARSFIEEADSILDKRNATKGNEVKRSLHNNVARDNLAGDDFSKELDQLADESKGKARDNSKGKAKDKSKGMVRDKAMDNLVGDDVSKELDQLLDEPEEMVKDKSNDNMADDDFLKELDQILNEPEEMEDDKAKDCLVVDDFSKELDQLSGESKEMGRDEARDDLVGDDFSKELDQLLDEAEEMLGMTPQKPNLTNVSLQNSDLEPKSHSSAVSKTKSLSRPGFPITEKVPLPSEKSFRKEMEDCDSLIRELDQMLDEPETHRPGSRARTQAATSLSEDCGSSYGGPQKPRSCRRKAEILGSPKVSVTPNSTKVDTTIEAETLTEKSHEENFTIPAVAETDVSLQGTRSTHCWNRWWARVWRKDHRSVESEISVIRKSNTVVCTDRTTEAPGCCSFCLPLFQIFKANRNFSRR
ncbi:uncharacterized protein [Lepisosteus oculatus]|uniref:uncharacterized protein n=1 Tax=Lepisosteus oculatus TaxID=7918 RepID=UPI00073FE314|nr:PREDICTED: uncharacterized protein LOC107075663 [Lepisosteus oculatus]